MTVNRQTFSRIILTLLLLMITARFHPDFVSAGISVYWADAIIGIVSFGWIVFNGIPLRYQPVTIATVALTCVLGCVAFLTIIFDGRFAMETLLNVFRYIYYCLFLLFCLSLLHHANINSKIIDNIIALSLLINLVVALIQLFEPTILVNVIHELYGTDKLRSLSSGYPRVYGCYYNANWFGIYLVFCGIRIQAAHLTRPSGSFYYLFKVVAILALLFLSGSRTAFLGLGLGVFLVFLWFRKLAVLVQFLFIGLSIGVLVLLGSSIFEEHFPLAIKTLERFTLAFQQIASNDMSEISSYSSRVDLWKDAWDLFLLNPLIGYGSTSLGIDLVPHNSYIALLLNVGLLGGFAVVIWLIYLFYQIKIGSLDIYDREIKIWFVSFSIAFAMMAMTGDFIYTTQVMLLWFFLIATVFVSQQSLKIYGPGEGK